MSTDSLIGRSLRVVDGVSYWRMPDGSHWGLTPDDAKIINELLQKGEIRDNAQSKAFNLAVDLGDKLFTMIKNPSGTGGLISWDRYEVSKTIEGVILEAMEPYLATRKPVSASRMDAAEEFSKAILEAYAKWQSRYQGVGHVD